MRPVSNERSPQPAPLVLHSGIFAGLPVVHGFTTRLGGISPPPFDSLNFSFSTGDSPGNVRSNELLLLDRAGPGFKSIATLDQVHGNKVVELDKDRPLPASVVLGEGDVIVTMRGGVLIGVKTADCTPILLFDPGSGAIAAAHAGWRGTAFKAASAAVLAMASAFGSRTQEIRAVIGPCVGACCYTVGGEVERMFADAFGAGAHLHRSVENGGEVVRADLQAANLAALESAGLKRGNIGIVRLCTSCNPKLFFSHRRDGGATGRHLNFIGRI